MSINDAEKEDLPHFTQIRHQRHLLEILVLEMN